MGNDPKKTLTITETTIHKQGTGGNNKPYTIYNVKATDAQGRPNSVDLRSFESLAVGETAEFYMKPYEKNGKVLNYTITRVGKKGGGGGGGGGSSGSRLGPKVDELRDRVEALEGSVEWLKKQLQPLLAPHLGPNSQPQSQPTTTASPPAAAPADSASRFGGDDDIPF